MCVIKIVVNVHLVVLMVITVILVFAKSAPTKIGVSNVKAAPNVLNVYQANMVTHASLTAKQVVKIAYAILIRVNAHVVAVKMVFTLIAGIGSVIRVGIRDAAAAAIRIRVTHVHQVNIGVHIASTFVRTARLGATK